MKRLASLILVTLAVASLTACNTMNGFGEDLHKVGDKISGAAKK
ncbi:MAG: entericidin A/B family lipoprotein [Burkholderiales bacterium]|nr:entericidin A/B family lipoprotein [Burkholderiales bacterium]